MIFNVFLYHFALHKYQTFLPEISTYIYGFDHIFTNEEGAEKSEERFIESIKA